MEYVWFLATELTDFDERILRTMVPAPSITFAVYCTPPKSDCGIALQNWEVLNQQKLNHTGSN